ncbi:FliM/FliN family flagellar motor switch protein [Paracoccus sediminicola]|uniref:FliM/FliN family flagellar motor switch protein n=1 Tax=Paracoccus sediminicola TaxID=3017783 RepID=UPI0022F04F3B|nr:FliM/FliN family flagellar motor switch protein [Paracoccus sediminicola]WBU57185.1 FliM/FliN family flagellar motor switch protein [Paracoccus sediminicola]
MRDSGLDTQALTGRLVLSGPASGVAEGDAPRQAVLARRRLGREQADVQNLLCRHRGPVTLRAGGVALQAWLAAPINMPAGGVWLGLEIDSYPARIGLSWGHARRLTGLPLESADPGDAALLIEEALSGWLDDVEDQTSLSLRLTRLSAEAPDDTMLRFSLRAELRSRSAPAPQRLNLPLALSAEAGRSFAAALTRWNRPRGIPGGVFLKVSAEIDSMRLSMQELRSLVPGDALVLPDLPQAGHVLIESQLIAPAMPGSDGPLPDRWVLQSGFAPRAPFSLISSDESKITMSDDTPKDPAAETAPRTDEKQAEGRNDETETSAAKPPRQPEPEQPSTLDAVEMRLSFRLGETLMSVADLRKAGPGTVVTLDRPDGAVVDILANGQLIGTGEVIAVAGQRAVEIRSLFGDD